MFSCGRLEDSKNMHFRASCLCYIPFMPHACFRIITGCNIECLADTPALLPFSTTVNCGLSNLQQCKMFSPSGVSEHLPTSFVNAHFWHRMAASLSLF